jgi:hypothetical protein
MQQARLSVPAGRNFERGVRKDGQLWRSDQLAEDSSLRLAGVEAGT